MPKVYCSSIIFVVIIAAAFLIPTEAIRGALFRSGRSGAFARQRPGDVVELLNPNLPVDSIAYSMNYPNSREEQALLLQRIQALIEESDLNDNRPHTTSAI